MFLANAGICSIYVSLKTSFHVFKAMSNWNVKVMPAMLCHAKHDVYMTFFWRVQRLSDNA